MCGKNGTCASGVHVTYGSSHNNSYGVITDLVAAGLLDARFENIVSGYSFTITVSVDTLDYTSNATARSSNDGRFDYYSRPDYVIYYSQDPTRAPTGYSGAPVQ